MFALCLVLALAIGWVHVFGCWAGTPEGMVIAIVLSLVFFMSVLGLILEPSMFCAGALK